MARKERTTELGARELDQVRGGATAQFNPESISRSLAAKGGGDPAVKITFTDLIVSSYQSSGSSGGDDS